MSHAFLAIFPLKRSMWNSVSDRLYWALCQIFQASRLSANTFKLAHCIGVMCFTNHTITVTVTPTSGMCFDILCRFRLQNNYILVEIPECLGMSGYICMCYMSFYNKSTARSISLLRIDLCRVSCSMSMIELSGLIGNEKKDEEKSKGRIFFTRSH